MLAYVYWHTLHAFTYIKIHIYYIKIILRTWIDRWQGENIHKSFVFGEKLVPRKYRKQHKSKTIQILEKEISEKIIQQRFMSDH